MPSAEHVQFTNNSTIANARYFWNFGDGTSARFAEPLHTFPASGRYFVTLFAKDTVSNCSDYFEDWITVIKPEADSSFLFIKDSIIVSPWGGGHDIITIVDQSINCSHCNIRMDIAGAGNYPYGNWANLGGWQHARFVTRAFYDCSDSLPGVGWLGHTKAAYQSTPYKYSSAKNYGDCSANFEFSIVFEDSTGQLVRFSAMNKNALSYSWYISGFGDPIYSTTDTVSQFYPFYSYYPDGIRNLVALRTQGQSGCKDTLYQHIVTRPQATTTASRGLRPSAARVYPNPFSDLVSIDFDAGNAPASLCLYNGFGQMVRRFENILNGHVVMERGDLPSGVYYFTVQSTEGNRTFGKVIAR
jgi:PKD repeat protein